MILDMDDKAHCDMWRAAKKDFFDTTYSKIYGVDAVDYTRRFYEAFGEAYNMVPEIDYIDDPFRVLRSVKFNTEKDYLMFVLKWS